MAADSSRRRVMVEFHHREGVAAARIGDTHPASLSLEEGYDAVPVSGGAASLDEGVAAAQASAGAAPGRGGHVARGHVHEDDLEALRGHPDVAGVWGDGRIGLFGRLAMASDKADATGRDAPAPGPDAEPPGPYDCDYETPKGDLADVARAIGADALWPQGLRGAGVTVGVVGGGITAEGRPLSAVDSAAPGWTGKLIPRVTGGWPNDWGTTGAGLDWHGNVMATGILGMAPEAELYDLRIIDDDKTETPRGMLSDALAAFDWAISSFRATGRPQVLNNSWGLFQASDAPDYAVDPRHVFTRKVQEAIDAGMIVLFAAGNCGGTCPPDFCAGDFGPGRSIWGANGAEAVITISAANPLGEYVGYASQGPAALTPAKPDVCGIAHYTGYARSDYGTSSACAVAAGAAALLKGAAPKADQARIKAGLMLTARQIGGGGWNANSGAGIIDLAAALADLRGDGQG
jgi:serine protease AprX